MGWWNSEKKPPDMILLAASIEHPSVASSLSSLMLRGNGPVQGRATSAGEEYEKYGNYLPNEYAGLKDLFKSLTNVAGITSIDIGECGLDGVAIAAVAQIMPDMKSLVYLSVSGNDLIGDDGMKPLLEVIKSCDIVHLDVCLLYTSPSPRDS